VVAANKQDKEEAWDIDDMRIALRIDPKVKFLPCVATDKETNKNSPRVVVQYLSRNGRG
jgi:signal recognition particle receptor subunit beta